MKRPVINSRRVKAGAVVVGILLVWLLAIPALGLGAFGEISEGDGTPGGAAGDIQQPTH